MGKGEKITSQHKISNRELCPGEEMEVKHFQVAQPRFSLTRKCCCRWCFAEWEDELKLKLNIERAFPHPTHILEPSHLKLLTTRRVLVKSQTKTIPTEVPWLEASLGTRRESTPGGILFQEVGKGCSLRHTLHTLTFTLFPSCSSPTELPPPHPPFTLYLCIKKTSRACALHNCIK